MHLGIRGAGLWGGVRTSKTRCLRSTLCLLAFEHRLGAGLDLRGVFLLLTLMLMGLAGWRISGGGATLVLGFVPGLTDATVMLTQNILGHPLHAENLNGRVRAVRKCIVNRLKFLLVDLIQVDT